MGREIGVTRTFLLVSLVVQSRTLRRVPPTCPLTECLCACVCMRGDQGKVFAPQDLANLQETMRLIELLASMRARSVNRVAFGTAGAEWGGEKGGED